MLLFPPLKATCWLPSSFSFFFFFCGIKTFFFYTANPQTVNCQHDRDVYGTNQLRRVFTLREGGYFGFPGEEWHVTAGWQTFLFFPPRGPAASWRAFYHRGFRAGTLHLTPGCVWPVRHSWCGCVCFKVLPSLVKSNKALTVSSAGVKPWTPGGGYV